MEMNALNSDYYKSPLEFPDLYELFDADLARRSLFTVDSLPWVQDSDNSSLHFLFSTDSFVPSSAEEAPAAVVPLSSLSEETLNSVNASCEATGNCADAFSFIPDASPYAERCGLSAKKSRAKGKPIEAQNGKQKTKGLEYGFSDRLSSEVLADGYEWLKYGTKSLKCTPYVRIYYKCSVEKCRAKRRVERDPHDGGILSVTYNGFHNHDSPTTYCIIDMESFSRK